MESAPLIKDLNLTEKDIKFDKSQSFEVKTNEINFKLTISYNDKILFFEIEKIGEFPKSQYNKYLNLDDLGKINKFFLQFESSEEIVNSFKDLITNQNLSIIEDNKQMKIRITNPHTKRIFDIDIPRKEKDLKSEIESIIPYISSLNNKVTTLTNKVDKLEKDLENKNNIIEELKNEINTIKKEYEIQKGQINELMSIKNEYEKLKKLEIKKENRYFKDSNIVKLEDENIIYNWFERKPIKFIKLLDSKIDGDSTNAFTDKCSKKCPTIVFVKTTNGYRFGGFTTIVWTNGSYGKDNKAFLFSLDRKEKYNITNESSANYLDNENSFWFGSAALRIYNNCTSNKSNYVANHSFETVPKNNGMNGGEGTFTVSSYEVYQLEY